MTIIDKETVDALGPLLKKLLDRYTTTQVAKELAPKIPKLVAIGVFTYIIKNGIDWAEEVLTNPQALGIASSMIQAFAYVFAGGPTPGWLKLPEVPKEQLKTVLSSEYVELFEWLTSFALAYLIVEHFGEIVQAIGGMLGGVLGLARNILGLVTLA